LNGVNGLLETLGLADHSDVIFEGKDLAQPGAENGLRIRHNHTDRAFALLRLKAFAWLDTYESVDRSAAHPSSFPTFPVTPYLRAEGRRGKPRLYGKLFALKTVFVNDYTDSTPATIFKAAHHSSVTIHLNVGFRADYIGGKRNRKIDSRTHGHIGIHAEQDAVGRNVLRLDRLSPDSRPRDSSRGDCRHRL